MARATFLESPLTSSDSLLYQMLNIDIFLTDWHIFLNVDLHLNLPFQFFFLIVRIITLNDIIKIT